MLIQSVHVILIKQKNVNLIFLCIFIARGSSGSGGDNQQTYSVVDDYADDEIVYQNIDPANQQEDDKSSNNTTQQVGGITNKNYPTLLALCFDWCLGFSYLPV